MTRRDTWGWLFTPCNFVIAIHVGIFPDGLSIGLFTGTWYVRSTALTVCSDNVRNVLCGANNSEIAGSKLAFSKFDPP